MSERTRFVGLDVHMATITVAVAEAGGAVKELGSITNDPSSMRKLVAKLSTPGARLSCRI